MKMAFILSIAFGVAAAAPVMSDPLDTAGVPTSGHRTIHHRPTFAKAIALAPLPALTSAQPSRNTDGLSRNSEDCNYSCIEH
jgi:hypothetical protein